MRTFQVGKPRGWECGLPPLLNASQTKRGQAALPNPEMPLGIIFDTTSMFHWIKFNLVGVLGFALQSAALFLLTRTTPNLSYLAATALAVELAVLNNFFWHQRWTWKDRPCVTRRETITRFARFNFTNGVVSIAGNLLMMTLLVGRMGLQVARANLIAVAACSILNFILADRVAFSNDEPSIA